MSFTGFPEDLLTFYEGLEADNSKAYWTDHRTTYDGCVRAPMDALLAELAPEFGAAKVFRPYRDVRFATDKTPYKTAIAASVGEGLYVQASARGLFAAGGYWHLVSDQLQRYRDAVVADQPGSRIETILAGLAAAGYDIHSDPMKRGPRGLDPDHPRAELLRYRSLTAGVQWPAEEWMHTPDCLDRIATAWRAFGPLNDWLAQHVGPSREPPSRRR